MSAAKLPGWCEKNQLQARPQILLWVRAAAGVEAGYRSLAGRLHGHRRPSGDARRGKRPSRSEEYTSELQPLMRISYAVFCLQNKTTLCYTTLTTYSARTTIDAEYITTPQTSTQ